MNEMSNPEIWKKLDKAKLHLAERRANLQARLGTTTSTSNNDSGVPPGFPASDFQSSSSAFASSAASSIKSTVAASSSSSIASDVPLPPPRPLQLRSQPTSSAKMTKSTLKPAPVVAPIIKKPKTQSTSPVVTPLLPKLPAPTPVLHESSNKPANEVAVKKRRASIIIPPKESKPKTTGQTLAKNTKVTVNKKTYVVDSFIGSGGSCNVYKAVDADQRIDLEHQRFVALKIVNVAKADREMMKTFENEIQFLRKLQKSSHVIKMHDYEITSQNIYVVMELGETNFRDHMKKRIGEGRLDDFSIRFYWSEMVKCVNVIHTEHIVHADLKPANFVLVGNSLKLIDFGIAAQIDAEDSVVCRKHVQGTLNYISPEAVNCRPDADGFEIPLKSDVWSLGCILYAMHYGRAPFAHVTGGQDKQLLAIRSAKIEYPPEPSMSREMRDVLKHCLTRDVGKRYSIEQLLKHPYVSGQAKTLGSVDVSFSQENILKIYEAANKTTPRTFAKQYRDLKRKE